MMLARHHHRSLAVRSLAALSRPNRLQTCYLHQWERLPGEGREPRKGIERVLGAIRAERFSATHPVSGAVEDKFDAVVGKQNHPLSPSKISRENPPPNSLILLRQWAEALSV